MKPETREEFKKWALKSFPREACGLVIIERGHEVFVPCNNLSELDDNFILDPRDYVAAEARGEIVRVVHSHCYIPARPSEADKVSCEASGLLWSILSLPTETWFDFGPEGYKAPLVGRTWAHAIHDCYGLAIDYYREKLGITLQDYNRSFEWWHKGGNLFIDNLPESDFESVPIASLREHDLIVMQIGSPVANHCGIYLGGGRFLHHLHRRLSCREQYAGYYRRHTVKVLRHKTLCEPLN